MGIDSVAGSQELDINAVSEGFTGVQIGLPIAATGGIYDFPADKKMGPYGACAQAEALADFPSANKAGGPWKTIAIVKALSERWWVSDIGTAARWLEDKLTYGGDPRWKRWDLDGPTEDDYIEDITAAGVADHGALSLRLGREGASVWIRQKVPERANVEVVYVPVPG